MVLDTVVVVVVVVEVVVDVVVVVDVSRSLNEAISKKYPPMYLLTDIHLKEYIPKFSKLKRFERRNLQQIVSQIFAHFYNQPFLQKQPEAQGVQWRGCLLSQPIGQAEPHFRYS